MMNWVVLGKAMHFQRRRIQFQSSFSWNEGIVIGMFLIAVLLWITRDLDGTLGGGWSVLFRSEYVSILD